MSDSQVGVTISRPGACDNQEIHIRIRVARGKTITAIVTPEEFALALTGKTDVTAELHLRNLRIEDE